jgi:two-component system, chemotaxis family, response regulator Rcp1
VLANKERKSTVKTAGLAPPGETAGALFGSHRISCEDTPWLTLRLYVRLMQARVLYVEDEDAAFFLFQTALKTAHIEVELDRAIDGEQALELLHRPSRERPRPDLVVLDLNLPRKNGFDVLSEIRRDPSLHGLLVVVFTSSPLISDKTKSIELGARDYITKPFSFDGFVHAVRMACAHLPAG